jgi:4-hydroxy-4-methyl-2-oxoglutarate aldolase
MPVTLHSPPAPGLTQAEIARWSVIPVAIAVDLVRAAGQIDPAIRPLRPAGQQPRLFGQAVTVRCDPPDFGAVLLALDVIQSGQVLVIDAGGYREAAMIGDILSGHLRAKRVAGIVCDGAVRDVGTLAGWDDFAVFARWINPRGPTGADRGTVNGPVKIGGTRIAPGDLVIGDDDGLVVLAPGNARALIAEAEAKLALEANWIEGLASGKPAAALFGLSVPIRD